MSRVGGVAPEAAFSALGSELRLRILHVLAEKAEQGEQRVSFSDIYDQLAIDSTSQLSYHLETLDGFFVYNSEGGYTLTQSGDRIVRAIRSGTYSERPSFKPTSVEGRCPYCDETVLSVAYRDSVLVVECQSCGERVVTYDLPPAESRERTNVETLHSCNRRVHHEYATALRGTCSTCGGVTELSVEQDGRLDSCMCVATCRECQLQLFAPLEVRLLYHPAVVSFYWRHGVDASTLPLWDLASYVDDWEFSVVERDPFEVHVTVAYEEELLHVTVDDELQVSTTPGESVAASE